MYMSVSSTRIQRFLREDINLMNFSIYTIYHNAVLIISTHKLL